MAPHLGWTQSPHRGAAAAAMLLLAYVFASAAFRSSPEASLAFLVLPIVVGALTMGTLGGVAVTLAGVCVDVTLAVATGGAASWEVPVLRALSLGGLGVLLSALLGRVRATAIGWREEALRRERLEREATENAERAASSQRLSALGTMVAGVAHEVNNPLTFIRGNLELDQMDLDDLLEREGLPPDARDTLVKVRERTRSTLSGVDRIVHIAATLKRLARGGGKRSPTDVNALVRGIVDIARPHLPMDADVRLDLQATARVFANETELSQVALNLLINAGQAVADVPAPSIMVRTRDELDHVLLDVEDNGPGVPPHLLPKLFMPFLTTKPHGTGLGLSLSHRIAAAHGGRLELVEGAPRGALFRVTLPAMPDARPHPESRPSTSPTR